MNDEKPKYDVQVNGKSVDYQLIVTWYRVITASGKLWCETSNREELAREAAKYDGDEELIFEQFPIIYANLPWHPIEPEEK